MSAENERLKQEMEFLSNLINQHRASQQRAQTLPSQKSHIQTSQAVGRDVGRFHRTFNDRDVHQAQKQFKPFYGNKKLDFRQSKNVTQQSSCKHGAGSESVATQGKPIVQVTRSLPIGVGSSNAIKQAGNHISETKKKSTVPLKNTTEVAHTKGAAMAPQSKGQTVPKPMSRRVVLNPGSRIASLLSKKDTVTSTSFATKNNSVANHSQAGVLKKGLANQASDAQVQIPKNVITEIKRKVLLPKSVIQSHSLATASTTYQEKTKAKLSKPFSTTTAMTGTYKISTKTSTTDSDTTKSSHARNRASSTLVVGVPPSSSTAPTVQTTEKIEAARVLLNQIKAMNTVDKIKPHSPSHLSTARFQFHSTPTKRDQYYSSSKSATIGYQTQGGSLGGPLHQSKYKLGKTNPEESISSSRSSMPIFNIKREVFGKSGMPSPIINPSGLWGSRGFLPATTTAKWVSKENSPVSNLASSSSQKESYSGPTPSYPSKYKFIRSKRRSNSRSSSFSSRSDFSYEHLSSLSKPPTRVVKLRTKYKLVKKAMQTKHKASYKFKQSKNVYMAQTNFRTARNTSTFTNPSLMKWHKGAAYNRKPARSQWCNAQQSFYGSQKKLYQTKFNFKSRTILFNSNAGRIYGSHYGRKIARVPLSKHRLDRRMSQLSAKKYPGGNRKLTMIGGVAYLTSVRKITKTHAGQLYGRRQSKLKTITVRGESQFTVGKQGKSLRRLSREISLDNTTMVTSIAKPPTSTQLVANRALQRSIHTASMNKYKKLVNPKGKKYCKFYNRFGRCNRGDKCKFTHDPEKVAVCTRFLRGTCKVTDCHFSHKVAPEKLPVCSYFLKGVCNRDTCPYPHVNVSKDAQVCQEFVNGFCALGNRCSKRHTLTCPEFSSTGNCKKGQNCKLKHISHKRKRINQASDGPLPQSKRQRNTGDAGEETVDDINLPLSERKLPSFIAIGGKSDKSLECLTQPPSESSEPAPATKSVIMFIKPRLSLGLTDSSLV